MVNKNCFFLQIQEIEINVDEQNEEGGEKKSAKEALLLWCQRNVRGYRNVEIKVYNNKVFNLTRKHLKYYINKFSLGMVGQPQSLYPLN